MNHLQMACLPVEPRVLVQIIPLYVTIGAGAALCTFQCARHMFTTPDVL